jgi:hypothetical protein
MPAERPSDRPRAPFASVPGSNYHIAIQLDDAGQHDLAAKHYQNAVDNALPGRLRDYCVLRFRQLSLAPCT